MAKESLQEGFRLHQEKDWSAAEKVYRDILAAEPENIEAAQLLGTLLLQRTRSADALEYLQRVLHAQPEHEIARGNFALALFNLKRFADADLEYKRLLEISPDNWIYYCQRAACAEAMRKPEDMISHLRSALYWNPLTPNATASIVTCLTNLGYFASAAAAAEKWRQLPGQDKLGRRLLILALASGRLFEAANALIEPADEQSYGYWHILAYAQHLQGKLVDELQSYRKALLLEPNHTTSKLNLGLTLLSLGQFEEGWSAFDSRFGPGGPLTNDVLHIPEWDGRRLNGEAVYVHSEQGLGDVIQFMRFFRRIESYGGRVIFSSYPDVIQLLKTQHGAETRKDIEQLDLEYQWQIPLLSLGKVFIQNVNDITFEPYMAAHPERMSKWCDRLSNLDGFRVGLVWAGSPAHGNDLNRSSTLSEFIPLGEVPSTCFVSLQKGPCADQAMSPPLGFSIVNLSDEITDFADTAAILEHIDLLICVDTSVAHLAGALGKAVWVLLPYDADWRWMRDVESTPWYPSMRLFRQRECDKGWSEVICRIKEALAILVRNKLAGKDLLQWDAYDKWQEADYSGAICSLINQHYNVPLVWLEDASRLNEHTINKIHGVRQTQPLACAYLEAALGRYNVACRILDEVKIDSASMPPLLIKRVEWTWLHEDYEVVLELAEQGIATYPTLVEFKYWRGQVRRMQKNWAGAAEDYQEVLKIYSRWANPLVNLGICLNKAGQHEQALQVIEKAVFCNPLHEKAWLHLGAMLDELGHLKVSRWVLERAVSLFPMSALLHSKRSDIRWRCSEGEKASEDMDKVLELDPNWPQITRHKAISLAMRDNWKEAEKLFLLAIQEDQEDNISMMWLAQYYFRVSRWSEGWKYWESRLIGDTADSAVNVIPALKQYSRWDGGMLGSRKLLVLCEQGYGDTLNFIHLLDRIDGQVILVLQDGLLPLFDNLDMKYVVCTRSQARISLPQCDAYIELMSLPYILDLGASVGRGVAEVIQPRIKKGHSALSILEKLNNLRVGIVWSGNPNHRDTHRRDCSFEAIANLLDIPNIDWCNLQKDEASNQVLFVPGAAEKLHNIAPLLVNWEDTANALSQIDLVITVDTALAHLAAAMGRPVWLLLSKNCDWRWQDMGDHTFWYSSMRLFRQDQLNNWQEVIERVAKALHLIAGPRVVE
ncbi:tetratricopeptide repeat protein [Chitinimonas sp. PSY-7]|uniref:tetratricopeptide repeat protein n=1 Tax=Chitinimonas sp. PSY-7 TaxID=3459088 RepID=UPI0040400A53